MDEIVWHYAVWRISYPSMTPACYSGIPYLDQNFRHGITIVRGDVDCTECKTMMGMPA